MISVSRPLFTMLGELLRVQSARVERTGMRTRVDDRMSLSIYERMVSPESCRS